MVGIADLYIHGRMDDEVYAAEVNLLEEWLKDLDAGGNSTDARITLVNEYVALEAARCAADCVGRME